MTDRQQRVLIVFAREPSPGQVKQRLSRDVGARAALKIYQRLLERTLRLARAFSRHESRGNGRPTGRYKLVVSAAGAWSGGRIHEFCANNNVGLHSQPDGDLGQRMYHAMAHCRGDRCASVVLIGSDCPDLSHADLRRAFEHLHTADAVIAPTVDGGYGLIGTRSNAPELFDAMPWGSERVAELTRRRCADHGIALAQLRPQADIDFIQDWESWCGRRARRSLAEHKWQCA